MSEYFETYTESHDGIEGKFYCEVIDGFISRHISIFNGVYYWATLNECFSEQYDFTDQPEFGKPDESTFAISKNEFNKLWNTALRQRD